MHGLAGLAQLSHDGMLNQYVQGEGLLQHTAYNCSGYALKVLRATMRAAWCPCA
jgi:hypothetical protein